MRAKFRTPKQPGQNVPVALGWWKILFYFLVLKTRRWQYLVYIILSHKKCSAYSKENPEYDFLLEFSEQLTNFVALLVFYRCCTIQFSLAAKDSDKHVVIELDASGKVKHRTPVSGKVRGLLYLNF